MLCAATAAEMYAILRLIKVHGGVLNLAANVNIVNVYIDCASVPI